MPASPSERGQITKSAEGTAVWFRDGQVLPVGARVVQPQLAGTLEPIAKEGFSAVYTGSLAPRLVDAVQKMGGIWTLEDLKAYKAIEREPLVGHYRGATIIGAPPPTSGGVALIEALNILSGYDLAQVDAVTRKHLIVEAMRRMQRDRAVYLGDPAFVSMPVKMLTDPDYAAGLRTSMRLDRASASQRHAGFGPRGAHRRCQHHAFFHPRQGRQPRRRHHHAQCRLRLRPRGRWHGHAAQQPDG